ncbi:hypothetical protein [Billgrantia endophytica]|uniref:DUF2946 domain-containing protein n=1 Tax=Billgrantia endophytica TaxID=2033802 RepID=A0A2N7U532_9GAMM|nr:hypothetical protein [Halomonas endophytica]PMR75543.1 hypothetical protein C1H69_10000 [Halomonas endophytica]
MHRAIRQLVCLCLILALSAGTAALAGFDAAAHGAHTLHAGLDAEHVAEHSTHHDPADDCWTPCLGASHCMTGAANLYAPVALTAMSQHPVSLAGHLPPPLCYLDERPPRTA